MLEINDAPNTRLQFSAPRKERSSKVQNAELFIQRLVHAPVHRNGGGVIAADHRKKLARLNSPGRQILGLGEHFFPAAGTIAQISFTFNAEKSRKSSVVGEMV